MITNKEFKRCLYLISYTVHEDEKIVEKVLNSKIEFLEHYLKPFEVELTQSLLEKETFEGKKDLIRYYLSAFWEIQDLFEQSKEILLTGSYQNYNSAHYVHIDENNVKRKLTEFENYVINCQIYYDIIMNEIQINCNTYRIDFLELCDQLKLSTEYFDTSITFIFKDSNIKVNNEVEVIAQKNGISEASIFQPQLFIDIFKYPTTINECLQLLRETDKPCIDDDNRYISQKGVFVMWFSVLRFLGFFKFSILKDIEIAKTLNHNFEGLNISVSMIRQPNPRAKRYQMNFTDSISAIKRRQLRPL